MATTFGPLASVIQVSSNAPSRRPRALVLVHEPYGGGAEVTSRLVERGVDVVSHLITSDLDRPEIAVPFPDLDGYDLVVPMGSVRSLVTREGIDSWVDEEIHLLRTAHESGVPVLGVCFGGQLLAEALGGSVSRAPIAEIGWYEIESGPDGMNPVGAGPWFEWHYDRFDPPPDASVLAVSDRAVQLFQLSTTVGTQFHPEVTAAHITTWLDVAGDSFLEAEGLDREVMIAEAAANEAASIEGCHRLVDWFLDEVAQLSLSSVSRTSDAEFMQ